MADSQFNYFQAPSGAIARSGRGGRWLKTLAVIISAVCPVYLLINSRAPTLYITNLHGVAHLQHSLGMAVAPRSPMIGERMPKAQWQSIGRFLDVSDPRPGSIVELRLHAPSGAAVLDHTRYGEFNASLFGNKLQCCGLECTITDDGLQLPNGMLAQKTWSAGWHNLFSVLREAFPTEVMDDEARAVLWWKQQGCREPPPGWDSVRRGKDLFLLKSWAGEKPWGGFDIVEALNACKLGKPADWLPSVQELRACGYQSKFFPHVEADAARRIRDILTAPNTALAAYIVRYSKFWNDPRRGNQLDEIRNYFEGMPDRTYRYDAADVHPAATLNQLERERELKDVPFESFGYLERVPTLIWSSDDGLELVVLKTSHEIVSVAKSLQNCAADYVSDVSRLESVLVALREGGRFAALGEWRPPQVGSSRGGHWEQLVESCNVPIRQQWRSVYENATAEVHDCVRKSLVSSMDSLVQTGWDARQTCRILKRFDLWHEFQSRSFRQLVSSHQALDLHSVKMDDSDAEALAEALKSNTALHSLNIRQNSIGAAGAEALAEALKSNTALHSLDIGFNSIGDAGAQALAEALKSNNALHSLNIEGNRIVGDAGAKALAEALKSNTALHSLNMEGDSIGAAGAEALAEALKSNNALHSLNVRDNSIRAAGAMALAEALKSNTALHSLNIRQNIIDASGAEALAEALKANTALHSLNVGFNGIGDAGAKALAEALKSNTVLHSLGCWHNGIGAAGAEAFAEALRSDTTLHSLDIRDNSIGAAGAEVLAEALKSNTALKSLHIERNKIGFPGDRAFTMVREIAANANRTLDVTM